MISTRVMHSSKPAQGKGVDSCQFRGVLEMPCAIRFFHRKRLPCMVLPAPSPGPRASSPSQPAGRRVERCHLTMEMGLPFLPASF
ncbi:hypothetical protein VZT92_027608 [Zoarces viviparus]|uniref:Uncharacterized protein n=1 Tax=Zoarces viviparus TaxID=48416 RepID=A0AAW1DXD6_ZOAVI